MKFKLKPIEKKWILYDIGNSAFALLISTIIPIYFNYLAGDAGISEVNYLAYWGYATSAATVIVAVLGPLLGTVSDVAGRKKKIFMIALLAGAFGCVFLGFMQSWIWFLLLFVFAKSAYSLSLVIYDSMLTDITSEERMDEVSAQGYAWGYIGSCVPFICSLLLVLFYDKVGISMQTAMGISFFLVAVWWIALTVPLLKSYRQTHSRKPTVHAGQSGVQRLGQIVSGFMQSWIWFLLLFVFAKSAYSLSLVIYDSMLTDITSEERMDEVSAQGYAWGYIGSCVPFICSLLLVLFYDKVGISMQTAMGISFFLVAVWWIALTVPLLKSYRQTHSRKPTVHAGQSGVQRLGQIVSELRKDKKVLFFLAAFFFYIDGVYTIIDMATAYGTALGLDTTGLLLALLLTQIVAFPAALLFGKISRKVSASRLILVCISAYFLIALYGIGLHRQYQFWILAVCVGCFQGAVQSMSRSYYAKIIPAEKSGEYFGIYDICGKGASFMGTILVSAVSQITGSVNLGVGALSVMFLAGFFLFLKADKTEKSEEEQENPGVLFQQPGLGQ